MNNLLQLDFKHIALYSLLILLGMFGKEIGKRLVEKTVDKIFGIRKSDLLSFLKRHWRLPVIAIQSFFLFYLGVIFTYHLWNINKAVTTRDVRLPPPTKSLFLAAT